MDGGMPVLIRVLEQQLSVRCLPVNESVSLRLGWDRRKAVGQSSEPRETLFIANSVSFSDQL